MKNIPYTSGLRFRLLTFLILALHFIAQADEPRPDERYHIIPLTSDTLPGLNIPRSGHVTLCLDGQLIVFGGHTDGFVPTPTAEYLHDGAWHTVPLVYPHDHGIVLPLRSGEVFLAGGHKEPLGIGQLFSAEIYDPAAHTSRGFGCMDRKRAYANALEMADGQVIIAGNWFADDGIEMFTDVNNPFNTNAVRLKDTSYPRATPYILRISDDDAIIFSSLDNMAEAVDYGIVDRLNGPSYREPLLDTWRPVRTINIQRSYNHFIGNEAEGRYEWLLPVENDEMRRVAIARVTGSDKPGATPTFSLLHTAQPIPDSINGKSIIYSSLVCDRDRNIAYLIGDNDEARVFVVAIPYDAPGPAPLAIYVTEPQPFIARGLSPTLTSEGDIVFAGGHLINNFAPNNTVIRLPLGRAHGPSAAAVPTPAPGRSWWLWLIFPILLAVATVVIVLKRREKPTVTEPITCEDEPDASEDAILDKNLPKDEILIDLFSRIERLMDEEQLYLNPNLRASDVAVRVGSNTAYVSAAINSQRRCSFTQFLAAYRIAYAQQLMRINPDIKISAVATQSGFSTDSTFFRAFRAIAGMSPKEWLSTHTPTQS